MSGVGVGGRGQMLQMIKNDMVSSVTMTQMKLVGVGSYEAWSPIALGAMLLSRESVHEPSTQHLKAPLSLWSPQILISVFLLVLRFPEHLPMYSGAYLCSPKEGHAS